MADNPTCATCRFWDAWHEGAVSGNCHRYAPRPGDEGGDWPDTSSAMWCGEHAPRAEASDRPDFREVEAARGCLDPESPDASV